MKIRQFSAVVVVLGLFLLALPLPANASPTGRRNTALGVSALAIYEIARGNNGLGLLSAAGAVVAWNRYSQGRREERCRDAFNAGFRAGVRRAWRECPDRGRHRGQRRRGR
jgi:hypothetical protein